MAPYRDLSEKDLLTTIGSCSSKVPALEKQRHLEQLAALSQDRVCQTKRIKKRIAHISDIIQNDPPYFFPRPYSYYNYYYRPFGGFLSALILLGLLDAIF